MSPAQTLTVLIVPLTTRFVLLAQPSPRTTWMVFLVFTVLLPTTLVMTFVSPALSRDTLFQILESVKSCVEMGSCFLLPMSAMMGIPRMETAAAVSVL